MKIKDLKNLLDIYDEDEEIESLIRVDGTDYVVEIKGLFADNEADKIYIFSKDE